MSDALGGTSMLVVRAMSLVGMVLVMMGTAMGTLTSLCIVLQAKDFLMMVMGQYRSRQHHYADYH